MKSIAKFTLFIAALLPAARLVAGDTCDFDQKAVLEQLIDISKSNPGGVLDRKNYQVTWKDASGKIVRIGHGGCVDLGNSIVLSLPDHIDTRTAVKELILTASKYWSPREANEVARLLTAGHFTTNRPAPGLLEFEADRGSSEIFSFGFTLTVQSNEVSLSWQEL
jgi:hypothetical protein